MSIQWSSDLPKPELYQLSVAGVKEFLLGWGNFLLNTMIAYIDFQTYYMYLVITYQRNIYLFIYLTRTRHSIFLDE